MPTQGEIVLLGQRYGDSDWRELRKRVGLVSSSIRQLMNDDEPGLETVISGKSAMIDFWGRVTRGDRLRAMRLLRQVEGTHLAGRPWRVLSQGERQRILIGRALMARPQLLILDEPCAGLDPTAREQFLHFLQRLGSRKQSPTLVLVTHHVEEIMPVFSHAPLEARRGAGRRSQSPNAHLRPALFGLCQPDPSGAIERTLCAPGEAQVAGRDLSRVTRQRQPKSFFSWMMPAIGGGTDCCQLASPALILSSTSPE